MTYLLLSIYTTSTIDQHKWEAKKVYSKLIEAWHYDQNKASGDYKFHHITFSN